MLDLSLEKDKKLLENTIIEGNELLLFSFELNFIFISLNSSFDIFEYRYIFPGYDFTKPFLIPS